MYQNDSAHVGHFFFFLQVRLNKMADVLWCVLLLLQPQGSLAFTVVLPTLKVSSILEVSWL